MEYYLNISNQAQGPFDEEEVRRSLQEGEIDADVPVRAATENAEWFPAQQLLGTPGAASAGPSRRRDYRPSDGLRLVRAHTCYGFLRVLIDLCAVALVFTGACGAGYVAWDGVAHHVAEKEAYFGVAGLGFVALVFLVIALRQWLFVFIDVADTLLAEFARKLSR